MNTFTDLDLSRFFEKPELICPTCGLIINGQQCCRRCRTDLSLLMKTATQAWKLRNRARAYLLAGEFEKSLHYIREAQTFHKTGFGELIERLAVSGITKPTD